MVHTHPIYIPLFERARQSAEFMLVAQKKDIFFHHNNNVYCFALIILYEWYN